MLLSVEHVSVLLEWAYLARPVAHKWDGRDPAVDGRFCEGVECVLGLGGVGSAQAWIVCVKRIVTHVRTDRRSWVRRWQSVEVDLCVTCGWPCTSTQRGTRRQPPTGKGSGLPCVCFEYREAVNRHDVP